MRLALAITAVLAALALPVVATAATSIRKLQGAKAKRDHLWENSRRLHAGLKQLGFTLGTDEPQSAKPLPLASAVAARW